MKLASILDSSPRLLPLIAASGFCGLLGVAAVASHESRVPSTQVPSIPEATTAELVRVGAATSARVMAPPPAPSNELLFVFRAGGQTWVKLGDDEPRHGKRTLIEDDTGTSTIAEVKPSNLPARLRAWDRETVTVDGTCTAHVTGFAVVTRLVGDPHYAGLDDDHWNVDTAESAGTRVLAAKLDGCKDGLFARRAELAPIVVLTEVHDDHLAALARASLLVSDAAHDAQLAWSETAKDAWSEHVQWNIRVLRHPTTGVTWIAVHASGDRECGGPDLNVWGLFRVARDGSVHTVDAKKLDTLYSIDRVIDVDNDGIPELVGKDWLGLTTILAHHDGEDIERLEMPFHGCPC